MQPPNALPKCDVQELKRSSLDAHQTGAVRQSSIVVKAASRQAASARRLSAIHLDLLRDTTLVNSHIVVATYRVLERAGELLPSRIATNASSE